MATNAAEVGGGGAQEVVVSQPATRDSKPLTCCQRFGRMVKKNLLIILIVIAMVLGIIIGLCLRLRPEPYSSDELMYLFFPGEMFLNMLKLTIIPLIMSSLISGLTSLKGTVSQSIGLKTAVYYTITTFVSVILGIILVVIIQPGKHDDNENLSTDTRPVNALGTFLNLIRNIIPDNVLEMTFLKKTAIVITNADNSTMLRTVKQGGTNMLGVVSVSIAVAICINKVGERAEGLKDFFLALNEVSILLISAAIWYSPVGVLFLAINEMARMRDPAKTFSSLAYYFLTVVLGLVLHGFVVLPLIYWFATRKNPLRFLKGMIPAMLTAIATASSLATLPLTMRNLEENNGVDQRVIDFVAPVGANINMDGTALYEAVAVIFIAQMMGKTLSFVIVITIGLTATAASIGAAGVPQAGLVTMVIVLSAIGLPIDSIGLILAVDWLLDRFRTSINVLGDAFGAGIIHYLSIDALRKADEADRLERLQREARSGSGSGVCSNCHWHSCSSGHIPAAPGQPPPPPPSQPPDPQEQPPPVHPSPLPAKQRLMSTDVDREQVASANVVAAAEEAAREAPVNINESACSFGNHSGHHF